MDDYYSLKEIELFNPIPEIRIAGEEIDLHNDYDCTKVVIESNKLALEFTSLTSHNTGIPFLAIVFTDVEWIAQENTQALLFGGEFTLHNLSRSRFLGKDGRLVEYEDGFACFALDIDEASAEFKCRTARIYVI